MKLYQFFLYLLCIPLVTMANEGESFLREVLCPTGNPKDLTPSEARIDYDTIKAKSTSWGAWLGFCTPSKQNVKKALREYVQYKSQEYVRTLLDPMPPGINEIAESISATILSELAKSLLQYEQGYPYCGLLRSFIGQELQARVRTIIEAEQAAKDKVLIKIFGNNHYTMSLSYGLVRRLNS